MKIRENGGRPFGNSAVRKQYSAEKTIFQRFDETANLFIGQMLLLPTVFLIRNRPVFLFNMYRFGPGLSTTSNNFCNRANFERLERRGRGLKILANGLDISDLSQ